MFTFEKRFWNWVCDHVLVLAAIAGTILSLLIHFALRSESSGDMKSFLLPWYETLKANGGLKGLKKGVGNFNIPYQTIIALFTYLPITPVYGYKIVSTLFDYLLAGSVSILAYDLTAKNKLAATLAYLATLALPIVSLNSAMWGQCDSIYTFFCIVSLIFFFREKYVLSFAAYGIAFAFKLQAVFLLPFLLFGYIFRQKYSILHFLIIPFAMMILSLPALVQGRAPTDVFAIYYQQTGWYNRISMRYPSIWNTLVDVMSKSHYSTLKYVAIGTTLLVLTGMMTYLVSRRKDLSNLHLLKLAFLFAYTCVILLPAMHDRYDYLYLLLALVIAVLDKQTIPGLAALLFISMRDYGSFLFHVEVNWNLIVALNAACYLYYCFSVFRSIYSDSSSNR